MKDKMYLFDGKEYSKSELEKIFSLGESRGELSQRVRYAIEMIEGKMVLDVGCASGTITKKIAERDHKVLGIDVLKSSIDIAKEFNSHPNATYEVRDLITNPFPENSFNCILFLETIEHVENPFQYLKEFHRILKPNGCLILSTPNATSLKNLFYALSYRKKEKQNRITKEISVEAKKTGTQLEHIYNWDFPVLIRLLDRCGFDYVDHRFAGSGPIVMPVFGKKIQIIKENSKILGGFGPLMSTHVIKAKKRTSP